MVEQKRLSTGLPRLDEALGGGLLPGTLTMIVGASGIGKTQLGLHFNEAGVEAEGIRGTVIDLSSRGDSQNHTGYSERMFDFPLRIADPKAMNQDDLFVGERPGDILPFLGYGGRRVLRSQLDPDQWDAWQSELNRRMPSLFRFVYQHLVHGTRRFLIDGIEPQDSASDSLQLDLLELIYHRMLRTEHDWLAREVLREKFRKNELAVDQHAYDHAESAAAVLVTTKQPMLEQLMSQSLADGDLAAAANTVILLGRLQANDGVKRGLYVAKHRGSFAESNIVVFDIDSSGIRFE